MSPVAVARGVAVILWALALHNTLACRGLFWDGSSFLVNLLDHGHFHDFYAARAHVDWVTQAPLLLLARLGVRDTELLAMAQSAALFALPTAFYHLALDRVRRDPVLLAAVLAIIAAVFLPTSFFIIGEYNVAFACITAAMAVALTTGESRRRDGVLLLAFGLLCLRSYEAMIYLGPLVASAILWSTRGSGDRPTRWLGGLAALAFIGAAVVSAVTIADYWDHPHFMKVRSTSVDFWQNMQFSIPLAGFLICALAGLRRPAWLQGRGPLVVMGVIALLLALSPWWRLVHGPSILYPPSHYVARQAAGVLLAAFLVGMWVQVARRDPPRVFAVVRQPEVARRMVLLLGALTVAGTIPDIVLTRLWSGYVERLRVVVDGSTGMVRAETLPLHDWPNKLFFQDWSYPALSAVVSRSPGQSYVVSDQDYLSNPPFEPACGLLPKLKGYGWRG
ncbi:hypothetical protein [Reyranella sp.]|uniref:hypothetical protein n=1 Tax=Reyranella sp. TaxID=1929291 RepID=UPI004036C8A5